MDQLLPKNLLPSKGFVRVKVKDVFGAELRKDSMCPQASWTILSHFKWGGTVVYCVNLELDTHDCQLVIMHPAEDHMLAIEERLFYPLGKQALLPGQLVQMRDEVGCRITSESKRLPPPPPPSSSLKSFICCSVDTARRFASRSMSSVESSKLGVVLVILLWKNDSIESKETVGLSLVYHCSAWEADHCCSVHAPGTHIRAPRTQVISAVRAGTGRRAKSGPILPKFHKAFIICMLNIAHRQAGTYKGGARPVGGLVGTLCDNLIARKDLHLLLQQTALLIVEVVVAILGDAAYLLAIPDVSNAYLSARKKWDAVSGRVVLDNEVTKKYITADEKKEAGAMVNTCILAPPASFDFRGTD
ncbi:hypothetical protein PR048_006525 [Dryococelus australis]|uniref:Uncharacterized protein n=1 Tax=Dryococelus australis TaxID=614101 RepID=A0ABQ9IB74_9NEOP|nr:hypothetical protein PR048_006525 [Dryococelus australis]